MDVRAIMAADNSSDDGDDTGVFDAQPQTQPLPPPPQQQSQLQQYQAPAATGTGGGGGGAVSALVQGIGGSGSGGKTGGGGPARFQQQVGAAAGAAAAGAVPERRKKTNELAELHDGDDDDNVTEEAHVQYEPRDWMYAFNVQISLCHVLDCLLGWVRSAGEEGARAAEEQGTALGGPAPSVLRVGQRVRLHSFVE